MMGYKHHMLKISAMIWMLLDKINAAELFISKISHFRKMQRGRSPSFELDIYMHVCQINPMKYFCSLYDFISIRCCEADLHVCIPFESIQTL